MRELTFTLLSDGSSDRALIRVLLWLLREHLPGVALNAQWADLSHLRNPPKTLAERMIRALQIYPCGVLFIHRDAEREPLDKRVEEIRGAMSNAGIHETQTICVIPVRMQEAWLLHEEQAIRNASGNKAGKMPLDLPPVRTVEQIPDPKKTLYGLLKTASGLSGRRLQSFHPQSLAHRVSEFIEDFRPLRQLSAFQALECEIVAWIRTGQISLTDGGT
jgi:hypothetical protein